MTDTHVVPVDDLIEHWLTRQCLCRPRIEEQSLETTLVVHHSYDGREAAEPDSEPEVPNA